MTQQEKYDDIVNNNPCKHRRGMGFSGCSCNKNYVQDPTYVDCAAYGSHSLAVANCLNCPFKQKP